MSASDSHARTKEGAIQRNATHCNALQHTSHDSQRQKDTGKEAETTTARNTHSHTHTHDGKNVQLEGSVDDVSKLKEKKKKEKESADGKRKKEKEGDTAQTFVEPFMMWDVVKVCV